MINCLHNKFTRQLILAVLLGIILAPVHAGKPLFIISPLTATRISLPSNDIAQVQYRVTNNTKLTRVLTIKPIIAVSQSTVGAGVCANPFILAPQESCILSLTINGITLAAAPSPVILNGPIVCKTIPHEGEVSSDPDPFYCAQPGLNAELDVHLTDPLTSAAITVTGSPLTLYGNGPAQSLTINNTSFALTATNVSSNFTGTALDGLVTQTASTCTSLPPGGSCILTFTPGPSNVAQTNFPIQGDNTNTLTAAITITTTPPNLTGINPSSGTAAGNAQVTLTGTFLAGTTAVTLGGIAATNVNVINSTTVTAVTPGHAAGLVDVNLTTPGGVATLSNGYTYLATAVGQNSGGGKIACLGGGLQNLITTTADYSVALIWGGGAGAFAVSNTDGATNTAEIVANVPSAPGTFAASACSLYEIDSAGNTPCQAGNACYNDWFLPALTQLNCLYTNKVAIGGFSNIAYWTSTVLSLFLAYYQEFAAGGTAGANRGNPLNFRCVRSFTP